MRLVFLTFLIAGYCLQLAPAQAIDERNTAVLQEHFASQGEVLYELFAPLGGPELGGAVIRSGNSASLIVAEVQGRNDCAVLYTQSVNPDFTTPPFTFLLTGQHLFVYSTTPWSDASGAVHARGDMRVISLLPENAGTVLYELKDVCDLRLEAGGALTPENLLWQPSPHFLNRFGFLPRKSNYFRLMLDFTDGEYKLSQHLTALPDAATVDWANLNNRALMNYSTYRLRDATYLLEQASRVAEGDQSVIARNQQYVKSEITDLDAQRNLKPDMPYNEALESFWQGDFNAVLRALEAREPQGLTDFDYAVYGLALAQLKRWAKADEVTIALERLDFPYMGDYLWEMVKIALFQDYPDVAYTYMLALQVTDPQHPGNATGMAKLERLKGNLASAEQILEEYLNDPSHNSCDVSEARLELYDLYFHRGYMEGCQRLETEAVKPPVVNLAGYVQLADYIDFSSAKVELAVENSDRLKAPDQPLEGITYQPGVVIE